MNTTDLRDTLARHADFPDHDLPSRTTSVRHRVRVVRRRRAAAGAGAVAAIVLGGFGLTSVIDGGDDAAPANRLIAGVEAPETIESLGYTFTFVEGVAAETEAATGEPVARGTVPSTGKPHLVSWGTAGVGGARVFARAGKVPPTETFAGDFEQWVLVEPGMEGGFVVRGADVAAVYELSGEAPGVRGHGVTFRDRVGSYELAGAEFGETGDSEVGLQIDPEVGRLSSFGRFCDSSVPGAQYQVMVDGEFVIGGACDGPAFDPGRVDNSSVVDPGAAGEVSMRLLPKGVDPATNDPEATLEDAEARLGVAFYQAHEPVVDALGADLEATIERDGHTWRHVRTIPAGDDDSVRLDAGARPRLVTMVTRFEENVSLRIKTAESLMETSIAPGGLITGPVLWPDEEWMVISPWVGHPVDGEMTVAVYEMVD